MEQLDQFIALLGELQQRYNIREEDMQAIVDGIYAILGIDEGAGAGGAPMGDGGMPMGGAPMGGGAPAAGGASPVPPQGGFTPQIPQY